MAPEKVGNALVEIDNRALCGKKPQESWVVHAKLLEVLQIDPDPRRWESMLTDA
jgi:hypothetical protein